ncbi:PAS domain-containing protein [Massilia aerilata]|uniref:histidine kinase n=1 Tax=Massilia aerilata TaxID=453817 RepID=A0ABW0RYH1_9BURK
MTGACHVSPVYRRKRMALAESVLDNLMEVVFQTDSSGCWMFLNQAWREMTGFDLADTLGKRSFDYVHPDDRQQCQALFQSLIAGDADECRKEVRYLQHDGSIRWVEAFARPALDEDGQLTGVAGTLADVTKRKAADDKLQLAANVFMHAGEGIMITSSAGLIVDVNSAFETITGYPRDEILGRSPKLLS